MRFGQVQCTIALTYRLFSQGALARMVYLGHDRQANASHENRHEHETDAITGSQ